jgi:cardiolipin synthase A/B
VPVPDTAYTSIAGQRLVAQQALSRAAGAPLLGGNSLELLIDAAAHFEAWRAAIRGAERHVLLENYIVRDDEIGRDIRDLLVERARAGVRVLVQVDWLGCLGQSRRSFWNPLRAAGGQVRVYNRPQWGEPLGWISRDHRKLLVVDGVYGSLSGVCISGKWLGIPARNIAPWRDTGVVIRGPAVSDLEAAFAQTWNSARGAPDSPAPISPRAEPAGTVALRVISTQPGTASVYRLDQLIAALASKTLWISDAYFVGIAPYVQALVAAAQDGVDVRMLVPSSSDIPLVASMARGGYRPLLQAGIRVYEWNGSMLHAKTAVADGQWARVGSSNLNISSWLGNYEIDVAVEDAGFASTLAAQFECDLQNATEIVLERRVRLRGTRVRYSGSAPPARSHAGGSASRATAGALRIANTVGAAIGSRRVLNDTDNGALWIGAAVLALVAAIAVVRPHWVAWPVAVLAGGLAIHLAVRGWRLRRPKE